MKRTGLVQWLQSGLSVLKTPVGAALVCAFAGLALAIASAGCVSKAKADARARAAFFAGQQQGALRAQQAGTNIMVMGAVRNNLVPWTPGLTLANALINADYLGQAEPKEILINRNGQQIRVDPKTLLSGQDVPLEANDLIEIR